MAKLQLALDIITLDDTRRLMEKLVGHVDIFELGTPFCLTYGVKGVEALREAFPEAVLLADTKIFDGGTYETRIYLDAGAKYVTVMARTNDSTIKNCVDACHQKGAECMVDMMCVENTAQRVKELEALGSDILAVHVAYDQYTRYNITPLSALEELSGLVTTAKVAVAGGITLESAAQYMRFSPDILIVGGGILNSQSPVDTAKAFCAIAHA